MAKTIISFHSLTLKQQEHAARFWSNINITADPSECWEWQKATDHNYGCAYLGGRSFRAHRLAWMLTHQKDATLNILHSCDNPPCCNPNHLREGTQLENIRDAYARGRMNYEGRVLPHVVRAIRQSFADGMAKKAIARKYGHAPATVRRIIQRQTWKHII